MARADVTLDNDFSELEAAANNSAAASAGVAVGGLPRTDADPSVVCVRTA